MTTPKQDRNGVPGPGATGGYVAQPGPDATGEIRTVIAQAEAAGNARVVPPSGSAVPATPAAANTTMWDDGLAVRDVEGGGSG